MNYSLIKLYLSKFLSDDFVRLQFKVLFWTLFAFTSFVFILGSISIVASLLINLPWGLVPIHEDLCELLKFFTVSIGSMLVLTLEMAVIDNVIQKIKTTNEVDNEK